MSLELHHNTSSSVNNRSRSCTVELAGMYAPPKLDLINSWLSSKAPYTSTELVSFCSPIFKDNCFTYKLMSLYKKCCMYYTLTVVLLGLGVNIAIGSTVLLVQLKTVYIRSFSILKQNYKTKLVTHFSFI